MRRIRSPRFPRCLRRLANEGVEARPDGQMRSARPPRFSELKVPRGGTEPPTRGFSVWLARPRWESDDDSARLTPLRVPRPQAAAVGPGGEEDVVRLEITVHHARPVRGVQRLAHLDGHAPRVIRRDRPAHHDALMEGAPVQELHAEERPPLVLVQVEHPHDAGMVEPAGHRHLAPEAVGQVAVLAQVRVEDLYRDIRAADCRARHTPRRVRLRRGGAPARNDRRGLRPPQIPPLRQHTLRFRGWKGATRRAAKAPAPRAGASSRPGRGTLQLLSNQLRRRPPQRRSLRGCYEMTARNVVGSRTRMARTQRHRARIPKPCTIVGACNRTSLVVMIPRIIGGSATWQEQLPCHARECPTPDETGHLETSVTRTQRRNLVTPRRGCVFPRLCEWHAPCAGARSYSFSSFWFGFSEIM